MTARMVLAALVVAAAVLVPRPARTGDEPVTFSDQVVRIFQQHCQECHRPGDIGPFALTDYRVAHRWREEIRDAVTSRAMPPWKPVPGFGEFAGVRRLSDAEIDLIDRWVAAGAPRGHDARMPAPRAFPDGWAHGAPDAVLGLPAPFAVASSRDDVYRCFVVPTDFPEDRWIAAVEFRPGNRKIVHHVLTYVDADGASVALDQADPGPGYPCFGGPGFRAQGGLGGWAPGARPQVLPAGVGLLLPKGARVVIQVHYHNREAGTETDRTAMGLHFARERIDKRLRVIPVINTGFLIPAGARRHEVTASYTLPPAWHLHAIGITPHMHLLGRQMTVTATRPDGTVVPLIRIDDWDFHWQGTYTFREPVALPGGTRIDLRAVFDNSAENRRNPTRPPRPVGWGEGTTDEMCIAFLRVTADAERLGHVPR
jgi:mono/diheme cytochrome c family protein